MADAIDIYQVFESKAFQAFDIIRGEVNNDYELICPFIVFSKIGCLKKISVSDSNTLKNDLKTTILSYKGKQSKFIHYQYHYWESLINQLSNQCLSLLVEHFNSLDKKAFNEYYIELFERSLEFAVSFESRYFAQLYMPNELAELVNYISDISEGGKVYNPFSGLASLAVSLKNGIHYLGQELNKKTAVLSQLRLIVHEKTDTSTIICDDYIEHWNPENSLYDLIFANPPYGLKVENQLENLPATRIDANAFFIHKSLNQINATGKIILITSQSLLFNGGYTSLLRRQVVESDILDMVISLPGALLPHTSVSLCLILINKQKEHKGLVKFIDASRFVIGSSSKTLRINNYVLNTVISSDNNSSFSRIVSNQIIAENDFNLSVNRYFLKQFEGVPLGDVLSIIRGQRRNQSQQGKIVRIRELKDDRFDYSLDIDSLEISPIPGPSVKYNESALLLATRWKSLKPTFYNFNNESVFCAPDIVACKVNFEKVDLDFLISELHSESFIEQFDSLKSGSVIPHISKTDLLRLKINLPSIPEQIAKVRGIKEAFISEKKKELDYLKKIHGLENDIIEQNQFLRHAIAGPLANLRGSFSNLKKIFTEQILIALPQAATFKVSELSDLNLQSYLEIINRDLEKVSVISRRNTQGESAILSKDLSHVEIIGFLENYVSEVKSREGLIYSIDFDIVEEDFKNPDGSKIKVYIMANRELLTDLFDNLIENAETHAFLKISNPKNRIEIFLMGDARKEKELSILVSNTGQGFPEGFSQTQFIRKGRKSGPMAGDGYGGWYINEIIKRFGGDFEIIDEHGPEGLPNTELATSFEITFPIIHFEADEKI